MGAELDRLEVAVELQATKAYSQLDKLAAKLEKIETSLSKIDTGALRGLATGVEKLGSAMKTMSEVKTSEFSRLARNIKKLSDIDASGMHKAASSMAIFAKAFAGTATVSENSKSIDYLLKKVAMLEKELGGAAKKTNNFSSSMSNVLLSANSSSFSIKKLASSFTSYAAKAYSATHRTRSLAQSWGMFNATFYPIIRGVKALGRTVESSMDYIETFNYFNVTMDKIGKEFSGQYKRYGYDSAEAYANSFSSRLNDLTKKMTGYEIGDNGMLSASSGMNLGLNPDTIMDYQASVGAITNSVGLMGETSVNTAKAFSMLAADMSSFKNVDLATVMTNLQSGLIGQSRALYKYGIDITNATLQTYAYKYGLSTAVSEMTQADKMQLRLLAILDQSRVAWGDQANTINSVANQYRILKQQISNVARTIGNLLIPIAQAVLPVINGVMMALGRLFSFIGPLIYGTEKWKGIMDGISSGYGGMDLGDLGADTADVADSAGNIGSNLKDADKTAKKLQRTILGFDQINKLTDNHTEASGSGSVGSVGGAGGIDLSNEIAAALADYESIWNKAFENSVNQAQAYADKICAVFTNMWNMIRGREFEELGAYIAGGVDLVFEKINSVFNWEKMGLGITGFMDGYVRTINSFVTAVNWANLGKTFGDGLNVITNTLYLWYAGIDWINIGTAIASGMNGMINSIDWLMLGRTVGTWIMHIPRMIYGFVTTLDWTALGTGLGTSLNGALMAFDGKTIAGGINGIVNGILSALKSFIETVDWSEVAKAVGDVLGNLDWGTLAKIGLAIGAVKLASGFGSLLNTAMSEWIVKAIGGGLDNVFKVIGPQLTGMKTSIAGLFAKGGIFGNVSLGAFGIIAAGIAAIIAGIIDLWKTSETFRDNVKNMLNIIGQAFLCAKQKIWDEGLKPLWDSIKELFGSLYEIYESSGLKQIFEGIVTALGYVASIALGGLIVAISEFAKFLANIVKAVVDVLNIALNFVKDFFVKHQDTIDGLKQMWHGLTEFLAGIFSGDWERAWNGVKDIFKGVWNTFVSIVKTPINKILGFVNSLISKLAQGFNWITSKLNNFKIDIPDNPITGEISLGFNIAKWNPPQIPLLAKGGLVNQGQLFLAREKGPELVGMHGNKAAVMNNEQLLDSVADGLKGAIAEAMIAVNMESNQQPSNVIVTLQGEAGKIFKVVQVEAKKYERNYMRPAFE